MSNFDPVKAHEGRFSMRLSGYVDVVSDQLIKGWAVNMTDPAVLPLIQLEQHGRVVCAVTPSGSYPELLNALQIADYAPSEGLYLWQIVLPLSNGITPNVPFDIRFSEDRSFLVHGDGREIKHASEETLQFAREEFNHEIMIAPRFNVDGDDFRMQCAIRNWPDEFAKVTITVNGQEQALPVRARALEARLRPARYWFLEHGSAEFDFHLTRAILEGRANGTLLRVLHPRCVEASARARRQQIRNVLFVPRSLFDETVPIPPGANIARISGGADSTGYRVGGATTLFQLNEISRIWSGRQIFEHGCVVDWGVGCARVLRHIWESTDIFSEHKFGEQTTSRLIGIDIDPVNIAWCQQHFSGLADFSQIDLVPPLELADCEVDFLYGISVMTHLTEWRQMQWLAENSADPTPWRHCCVGRRIQSGAFSRVGGNRQCDTWIDLESLIQLPTSRSVLITLLITVQLIRHRSTYDKIGAVNLRFWI